MTFAEIIPKIVKGCRFKFFIWPHYIGIKEDFTTTAEALLEDAWEIEPEK